MAVDFGALLAVSDEEVAQRWERLLRQLERQFDRQPGIEAVLFLIGVQARGRGYEPGLGKQLKQDLIMEGTHRVFETLGLYKRVGIDSDGLTLWERNMTDMPQLSLNDQEKLLRIAILSYFEVQSP